MNLSGLGAVSLMVLSAPFVRAASTAWNQALKAPPEWYASAEARAMAENVLLYQAPSGGWPKNLDLSVTPTAAQRAERSFHEPTIDNGGTTQPVEFLARVASASFDPAAVGAVERGVDYLLAAQLPSGGWPQFFPLRPGYYSHITYNDGAMVNVLTLLRAVSQKKAPYQFLDDTRRTWAAIAVEQGITCILATQIKQAGALTVWCAQHDETTLQPAWARNFEPPSLSGSESVAIVRFLLSLDQPSPEIVASITGAAAWLRGNSIRGLRVESFTAADGHEDRLAKADPTAPPLWARFYELKTNRPIFLGRDRVVHYDHNEIERERRTNYSYLGEWPADLLDRLYLRWQAKQHSP